MRFYVCVEDLDGALIELDAQIWPRSNRQHHTTFGPDDVEITDAAGTVYSVDDFGPWRDEIMRQLEEDFYDRYDEATRELRERERDDVLWFGL